MSRARLRQIPDSSLFCSPCLFCREHSCPHHQDQSSQPTPSLAWQADTGHAFHRSPRKDTLWKAASFAPMCQDIALVWFLHTDGQQICTGNLVIDQEALRLLKSGHHVVSTTHLQQPCAESQIHRLSVSLYHVQIPEWILSLEKQWAKWKCLHLILSGSRVKNRAISESSPLGFFSLQNYIHYQTLLTWMG